MINTDYKQMIAETPVLAKEEQGLYADLTYKMIGALYEIHHELGSVHKEIIYRKAVALIFREKGIDFIEEGSLPVFFGGQKIGIYRPDFIVEDKVILELKAVPCITKSMLDQVYYYMNGSSYQLALLVNFGTPKLTIKRRIFTH